MLNEQPTKAADIFSLGITFLELITDLDLPNSGSHWERLVYYNFVFFYKYLIFKRQLQPDEIGIRFPKKPFTYLREDNDLTVSCSPQLIDLIERMMDPSSGLRPSAAEILDHPAVQHQMTPSQRDLYELSKVKLL